MYQFPDDMRRTLEALPVPMAYYQHEGEKITPLLVTDGLCRLMQLDRKTLTHMLEVAIFERVHPDDAGLLWKTAVAFANHESRYDVLYRACYDDTGIYRYYHTVGHWQTMPDGTEIAVLNYTDITAAMEEDERLRASFVAQHHDHFYSDPVTQLHNGNYFHEFADEKVQRLREGGEQPMLIYINVDSMRSYNNQYGVAKGDALLRLIADELKSTFHNALIVRLVDDKFAVLTGAMEDLDFSYAINSADQAIRADAEGNTIGIQAGVCVYDADMTTSTALDRARHAFRQIGDDLNIIYNYYSRDTEEQYWEERYIIENFDTALEEGWIQVYYQTLNRIATGKTAALEALARWVDPEKGVIPPGVFIPVLEKHHLLYNLDLYMVEMVCQEIPGRQSGGLPLQPVSINFSAQDFDHVDVADELNHIIDRYHIEQYDLSRHDFIVEITEQDLAQGSDSFRQQLKKLRESNYRLWIDDFGSGYSSLNVFSQYDFDLVKFDIELLRHLDDNNGANRVIMKTITQMCSQLGVLSLAEGVETQEQLDFLRSIDCEFAQGFYMYYPQTLDQILERLEGGEDMVICETREERHQRLQDWFQRHNVQDIHHIQD